MLYLAMTAAEIAHFPAPTAPLAWMACHFSPYGTGLSNLPRALPPGSMLILNDRTPVMGHDPLLVARQLHDAAETLECSCILLDFQRPGEPETMEIARAVVETAKCPVGIAEAYAADFSCPVFLPPVPLLQTPTDYLSPWQQREVWLELAPAAEVITVTETGSSRRPVTLQEATFPHFDPALCCHYGLTVSEDAAVFTLQRDPEALQALQQQVQCSFFVGLYQQLGEKSRFL